jgi:LacI family transcriptional regulator
VVGPSGDAWRRSAEKPVVVIGNSRHQFNCHVVVRNNEADARLATQHLIDQGRRNIVALVTGTPTRVEKERIAGYKQSMAEHDLAARVRFSVEGFGTSAYSDSVEAMAVAAEPFDAIIGISEFTTFPALRSLHRLRLRVPEDVAIVGFESAIAALATDPPLTTIEEPSEELARRAVDAMLRLINGETPPPECDRLPGRLVERSST